MTAAYQPQSSRDDDDRRAWLASQDTALLGPLPVSGGTAAETTPAEPSITAGDVADMPTLLSVPPQVEATVAYQLFQRANWHEDEAARLRRYARDTRENVAQMQGILNEWEPEWLMLAGIPLPRRTSWQERRHDYLQARIPLLAGDINKFAASMMAAEREATDHEMSAATIRRTVQRDGAAAQGSGSGQGR